MLAIHTTRLLAGFKRAFPIEIGDDEPHDVAKRAMDTVLRDDEDVLTALVFERLRYLPATVAWRVLVGAASALRGDHPEACDDITIRFWPTLLHPADGRTVEPDIVWTSRHLVLGIEVKWNDVQTVEQLDREHAALERDTHSLGRAIVLLALGGTTAGRRESLRASCSAPTLLALDWKDFYAALRTERARPERAVHEQAVLEDLMAILAIRQPLWAREPLSLASLPSWPIALPDALAVPFRSVNDSSSAGPRFFSSLPPWRVTLAPIPDWRTQ